MTRRPPRIEPRRSRRLVLTAGVTAAASLLVGPSALSGCTSSAPAVPPGPDPLESPARRAESDAALARAVSAAHVELAPAAGAFAADRQAHAVTLRAELRRVRPQARASDPNLTRGPSPAPVPGATVADQENALEVLARAVRAAHEEAAGLVVTLPGYRAALLASVAACCASHAAVLP